MLCVHSVCYKIGTTKWYCIYHFTIFPFLLPKSRKLNANIYIQHTLSKKDSHKQRVSIYLSSITSHFSPNLSSFLSIVIQRTYT